MKQDIESLLLINRYLSICKIKDPNCLKVKLIRGYFRHKLYKVLNRKKIKYPSFSFK